MARRAVALLRLLAATAPISVPSLLPLALLGACGGNGASETTPVVLLAEVDTLRADALGCYGNEERGQGWAEPTPNLDALASDGVRFERAYSAAPWTVPSLATQLSGRWPWDHQALRLIEPMDDALVTLAERFRAAGWRTAGVSANFVVKRRYGFAQGFERFDEQHAQGHEGSYAHAAVDTLLELTDELAARPGEGLFLFLLLFEPHYLYEEQAGLGFGDASYAGRLAGAESMEELRAMRAELDEADVRFLRGRYQGEVARADEALGRLLDGLRSRGMMGDAVVCFTADHGEEIMDRGWIGHTRTLFDELVRVPLIVRLPQGRRGRLVPGTRIDAPVSQIDLGATLLDLVGIEGGLGEGLSFASTLTDGAAPARRYLYLHTDFEPPLDAPGAREKRAHQWGVVDAQTRLKWVVDHLAEGGPTGRLYDLDADPAETVDLAARGGVSASLKRLVALDPARGEASAAPLCIDDEGTP